MVSKVSWQQRVENAGARKKEAKQRKQRSEEKRVHKGMVQELLDLLDRHVDKLTLSTMLHIWIDMLPSDSPPLLDMIEGNNKIIMSERRRARSGSLGSVGDTNNNNRISKGQRGRSGSFNDVSPASPPGGKKRMNNNNPKAIKETALEASEEWSGSLSDLATPPAAKKRVHPRSKEASSTTTADGYLAPRLCRSHFFTGKCDGKRGGCRHLHYSPRYKTLAAVVVATGRTKEHAKHTLYESEVAAASDESSTDPSEYGSVGMVYHIPMELGKALQDGQTLVSEHVAEVLSSRSCGTGSIVYVALNDCLLFDRYRDGAILSEVGFLANVVGEERRLRGDSVSSQPSSDDEADKYAQHLPGPILEYILSFLPETAVAASALVCRAWYREIGRTSPNLWRHLLERREWPLPPAAAVEPIGSSAATTTTPEQQIKSERERFRDEFVMHYSLARDVKALQTAISVLTTTTKNKPTTDDREFSLQAFSTRRGAPQYPNCCVALEVWSPNRILAAYAQDCSVRLFNVVSSRNTNSEKLCRELVFRRIDPYKNTKKKTCCLVGMGLDDEMLGCLCHVMGDHQNAPEAFVLAVISRDAFLEGTTDGNEELEDIALCVIDIGECVLNFLLSCEDVDHTLLQVHDFLLLGGDIEEVEVLVSHSIAACGYGRFMVEVAISLPRLDDPDVDDDDSDTFMVLVARKLFLISANAGAIVWMGDSNPANPRREDMSLGSIRRRTGGLSRTTACTVASVSASSPDITVVEISPSGHVQSPTTLVGNNRHLEDGLFELVRKAHRPVIVAPSDVVVADTFVRSNEQQQRLFKSVVSFYPRFPVVGHPDCETVTLQGNCEVLKISLFRDHHILLICKIMISQQTTEPTEFDDIAGEWFGTANRTSQDRVMVYGIVIEIRTRREIQRVCLQLEDPDAPLLVATDGDTVGAGIWWKGVAMTGNDVRSVGATAKVVQDLECKKAAKKKKKRKPAKGSSKKDGFARGMSLRG